MDNKETIEAFIKRHGDKYDYSKTNINECDKLGRVTITCPKHGDFLIHPECHLSEEFDIGCPSCRAGRPITKKEFIFRSKLVHGDRYDYSETRFPTRKEDGKICIICPEHGEFWQTPKAHMNGSGCKECWENRKKNVLLKDKEYFIKKANALHEYKYRYDKFVYTNSKTKGIITCPEHGDFSMRPNSHLNGRGCPICGKERRIAKNTLTNSEFVDRAKEIYGDKYDYSKVKYINSNEKVCVICPEHGEFWVKPNNFINGKACRECGIKKRAEHKKIPQSEVIKRFKEKHGDYYNYDKVVYNRMRDKVTITCPKHGDFECSPANHIAGKGCPKCKMSYAERDVYTFLKNNEIEYVYEASKKELKWLGRLSLDFYLPKYNIAIECQGLQHFKPIEYFGGNKKLAEILKRDEKKRNLCEKNGIKVVYYSNENFDFPYMVYKDLDELFEMIKKKNTNDRY